MVNLNDIKNSLIKRGYKVDGDYIVYFEDADTMSSVRGVSKPMAGLIVKHAQAAIVLPHATKMQRFQNNRLIETFSNKKGFPCYH
jgi:hypothetical protein